MKDIKIIFFDIDGTLISRETPHLTEELKGALHALQAKGIKLCVSTGRHLAEIKDLGLDKEFPFDAWITLNGAYCYNDEGLIFSTPIPNEDLEGCIRYVEEHDMPCIFMEDELTYLNLVNDDVREVQAYIHTEQPPLLDLRRGLEHPIYLVVIYARREEVNDLLPSMPHCKATSWHPLGFDIFHQSTGKERGIQALLDHFGLTREEAMAFGDGENDISMLDYVALPVAMGNAHDFVKEHGAYVTTAIDEGGIVHALKHFEMI